MFFLKKYLDILTFHFNRPCWVKEYDMHLFSVFFFWGVCICTCLSYTCEHVCTHVCIRMCTYACLYECGGYGSTPISSSIVYLLLFINTLILDRVLLHLELVISARKATQEPLESGPRLSTSPAQPPYPPSHGC